MNFYPRHLGDYARDTAHLSMLEHGAYNLLLDRYYGTEQGIPDEQKYRVTRARTPAEKLAIDVVQAEFFCLENGLWQNKRADEEIGKFNDNKPRADAKKENDRERQRRAREHRKSLFETLAQYGVNLAWNATTLELQNAIDRVKSPLHHLPVTPGVTASVTPPVTRDNTFTRNHEPDTNNQTRSEQTDSSGGTPAGAVCARLKKLGIVAVNPSHPKLLALLKAGLTVDEITSVAIEPGAQGKGFAWILAAAEGRRRDAAALKPLPVAHQRPWFLTASGIEGKAAELGVVKSGDEAFPAFKARVYEAAKVTDEMVRAAKSDFSMGGA